jgi:hypothetical protein
MIPRVRLDGTKDVFAFKAPVSSSSQVSLPESSDFTKYDGVPLAWYPQIDKTLSRIPSWSLEEVDDDLLKTFF